MSGEERRKIVNPAERYTEISFFIRIILDKLQIDAECALV